MENLNDTIEDIKDVFKDTADRSISDPKNENERHEYNIIKIEYNANPIQLYKMFKETMKNKYKIEKIKLQIIKI